MSPKIPFIPAGFHAISPFLITGDTARAVEFYQRAFGATEVMHHDGPDGKISHAELRIGDSLIMISGHPAGTLSDPETLPPVSLYLYVADVDATFRRALEAGARELRPVADEYWGDRCGGVTDPVGVVWWIATHQEDVSPAELSRRAATQSKH
jgi:PhnB protein